MHRPAMSLNRELSTYAQIPFFFQEQTKVPLICIIFLHFIPQFFSLTYVTIHIHTSTSQELKILKSTSYTEMYGEKHVKRRKVILDVSNMLLKDMEVEC